MQQAAEVSNYAAYTSAYPAQRLERLIEGKWQVGIERKTDIKEWK